MRHVHMLHCMADSNEMCHRIHTIESAQAAVFIHRRSLTRLVARAISLPHYMFGLFHVSNAHLLSRFLYWYTVCGCVQLTNNNNNNKQSTNTHIIYYHSFSPYFFSLYECAITTIFLRFRFLALTLLLLLLFFVYFFFFCYCSHCCCCCCCFSSILFFLAFCFVLFLHGVLSISLSSHIRSTHSKSTARKLIISVESLI